MDEERTQRVYLFDGTNFSNWSFRMEAYLEELGLVHCIRRTLEEEDFFVDLEADTADVKAQKEVKRERRKQQDAKCKSIIIHKIADSHLDFIKGKTTPKEIWSTLERLFEKKGVAGIFYLLKQMSVMRYDENRPLEEHIVAFEKNVRDLESAGVKFDEKVIVFNLLQSMPKSYGQLITVLETLPVEQCSLEFVKTRLLSEGVKRQLDDVRAEPGTAFSGKGGKFVFTCHACGKPGHKRVDCPNNGRKQEHASGKSSGKQKRKPKEKANSADAHDVAFVGTNDTHSAGGQDFRWILDSGASEHMVRDRKCLYNVRRLEQPVVITVAKSGQQLVSELAGEVRMLAKVGGKQLRCVVYDVLFVPDLTLNLFSVKKIGERGMRTTFTRDEAYITKADGSQVCTATRKTKLFELNVELIAPGESALAADPRSQRVLWHRRYGHIGNAGLAKLVRCNMVDGLDVGKNLEAEENCESCMKGKQVRLPFSDTPRVRSNRPLELIHTDVCGPFKPAAWDGGKMFVTFIDDFTHFTAVYVLKAKSDVLDMFKKYAAMAEAHFERRVARIRCDNGGEYVNEEFISFCEAKGIVMETTAPYTPQQNGVAERMNRTIMERSRAMLDDSGFKRHMWNEAVQAAVYTINRSPTSALPEPVTPFEKWYGRKPNVSKMRVFGSKAFVHIPKEKRNKLDDKSKTCYFVGYAVNGYRLWDSDKRKVFVSRDVVVEEAKPKISPVYTSDHLVSDKQEEEGTQDIEEQENHDGIDGEDRASNEDESEFFESVSEDEEEAAANTPRRSDRKRKQPERYSDYHMYGAFALNAESYAQNLPETIDEARKRDDWPEWKVAINDEMKSLEKNHTWDLVDLPEDCRAVPCKWVFKIKNHGDETVGRYKARLVAKGCSQRHGLDYQETYAPVVRMSTVRTLLSVAVQRKFHLHQMDVRTAFLNGTLSETVYMQQPPGFERGKKVCRLNKSLYGLKQAPRSWNERFHNFMVQLGFQRSQYDSCLYTRTVGKEQIYVVLYVDDIILASNSFPKLEQTKKLLAGEFDMTDLQELRNFLGLRIQYDRKQGTLSINQTKYLLDLLKRFGMESCKPVSTPLEPNIKLEKLRDGQEPFPCPYRELTGCLTYLMLSSRPDICATVNLLSRFQSAPSEEHWKALKRVLRYLQGTKDLSLVYQRDDEHVPLLGFVDADWGSDVNDRRSTSGFCFNVFGNVVAWVTRKQATIALSSTEAEYVALSQAACEAIWLRNLVSEFGFVLDSPVVIFEDNQSCIQIAKEPRDQKRLKHLDIRYNFVRERIQHGEIELKYVSTQDQVADILTKGLPTEGFKKHRHTLGLSGGVVKQTEATN